MTWKLECKLEKKRVPNLVVYLQNHKLTLLFGKGKKQQPKKVPSSWPSNFTSSKQLGLNKLNKGKKTYKSLKSRRAAEVATLIID